MDPDENLKAQLALAEGLLDVPGDEVAAERLADLVLSLDEHLRGGGLPPERWRRRLP